MRVEVANVLRKEHTVSGLTSSKAYQRQLGHYLEQHSRSNESDVYVRRRSGLKVVFVRQAPQQHLIPSMPMSEHEGGIIGTSLGQVDDMSH